MTEYTIIEQILGTIFVILLIIFILGKKFGVKWFSTLKMWYKGNWKEELERKQTMKEKKHTLVGWKELPLYILHPKMLFTKEWPFTEWGEYDEKTNTQTWYHWAVIDSKSNWSALLHLSITITFIVVRFILFVRIIGYIIFNVINPLIGIILDLLAESVSR